MAAELMRILCCAVAAVALLPAAPLFASPKKVKQAVLACPADVRALLAPFAKVRGVSVDFTEEKHIALLAKPVVNRGRILFLAPDQLVRRVEEPTPSAVWLRGTDLVVRDAAGERKLDVGRWGPANVLVSSFLYVLRGDVVSLLKHYDMTLTCEAPLWRLRLVPKDKGLGKLLGHLVISGRGDRPEVMEVLDGSGDRAITRFANEDRHAHPAPADLEAFFRAPAPGAK